MRRQTANSQANKIRISVEASRLRPGSRQAGGGDRNDLGQATRRSTQE
jgi:hypothetical protein